jgi:hypothetical protein
MAFGSLNLCRFHWETQNLYQGIVWQWRCEVSPKQLLYSLSWIVPLVGGILSLIVIWFARQSSRASNQYIPAFMLNAIGIILVGLGSLFLTYLNLARISVNVCGVASCFNQPMALSIAGVPISRTGGPSL